LANGRLAAERETLEKAQVLYQAEKAEAAELEDMKKRAAALEAAEIAVRTEADNLRQEISILHERVATYEARTVEIEKRADDLNAELTRVNIQNSEMVRALVEAAKGKSSKGT